MKVTIVYITGRSDPRVDWAVSDLNPHIRAEDEIHLIVVDTQARSAQQLGLAASKLKSVIVTRPKPTIWQGPHRVTKVDWWANSNARNTGIVLCKTDYIAFLDDRCHLGGAWLDAVRAGEAKRDAVIAGSYEKHENGQITRDHRLVKEPGGKRDCGGGWLYGCTFALPLEWCLEANGFEEGCDGLSGEDYIFGYMLENNGHRIDFSASLFVSLERSEPHLNKFFRTDKGVSPNDKSHAAIDRFKKRKRTEFTADLRAMREGLLRGGSFPIPDPRVEYRDWFDGSLIKDQVATTGGRV